MARRNRITVLTASLAIGIGMTAVLAACSTGDDAAPSGSASPSASRSTSTSPSATPTDDQTGSADDGTGPGTGNGSGVDNPTSVDWATVTKQGLAAAGGGTVVSLTGSGDNWTVVVADASGARTQSVVSATLARVTSGPFPTDADSQTMADDVARAASLQVDAAAAATDAEESTAGAKLSSLVLGGTGAAPVWTATLTVSGATTSVTVDGKTGATTAS